MQNAIIYRKRYLPVIGYTYEKKKERSISFQNDKTLFIMIILFHLGCYESVMHTRTDNILYA